MKVMWSMGGGAHTLAVDAVPKYTNIGLAKFPDSETFFPVLTVEFTLEDLRILAPTFGALKQRSIEPEVYVLGRGTGALEFLARFVLPDPDEDTLRHAAGASFWNVAKDAALAAEKREIVVLSAGDLDAAWTDRFFEAFAGLGFAAVMVAEARGRNDPGVEPLMTFLVHEIRETEPPSIVT